MVSFAPLTKEEALTVSEVHEPAQCAKGKSGRWRRNGQTKTWKRSPERFALPVKHGLYAYETITDGFYSTLVCPAERCPVCNPEKE